MYIDGLLAKTSSVNGNQIPMTDNPVRIAANNLGTTIFKGQIDDVRIWNYAVDVIDIAQIYVNVTDVPLCTGPVAFDTTGPEGVPDCVVDLLDYAEFVSHWLNTNYVYPEDK